jgi:hypothetical protein
MISEHTATISDLWQVISDYGSFNFRPHSSDSVLHSTAIDLNTVSTAVFFVPE